MQAILMHNSLAITPPTNFEGNNLKCIFQSTSGRSHKIPPREGLNLDFFIMICSLKIPWQQSVCFTIILVFYRNYNLEGKMENKIEII